MSNQAAYWARVVAVRSELPEFVWLTSLENHDRGTTEGVVALVDRETAALCLVNKTHRAAEQHEVDQYKTADRSASEAIREEEYKRKQHFALPKELSDLVSAAVRGVPAPARGRGRNNREEQGKDESEVSVDSTAESA